MDNGHIISADDLSSLLFTAPSNYPLNMSSEKQALRHFLLKGLNVLNFCFRLAFWVETRDELHVSRDQLSHMNFELFP